MKKLCIGLIAGLVIGVLLTSASGLFAASNIKLVINGKEVICDTPPQMINGRVMVPARFVAEGLNASASWDGANQTVNISSNGTVSNTIQSTVKVNPDKAEFLALNKEVDGVLSEIDSLLAQGSISKSEYDAIHSKIVATSDKLRVWGELLEYSSIKSLYFSALTDGLKSCILKEAITNPEYSNIIEKTKTDYATYQRNYSKDKMEIQAEKTRLQKLGYL